MKTARIDGTKAAEFDKLIIGNLLLTHTTLENVKGEKMIIGIRNEGGEIYRLIGATRIHNFMNAVEELIDLDLVNELQDIEDTRDGCDAIFSGL